MEIKPIFAEKLLSFKYDNLFEHEYDKKLDQWQDFNFIYEKAAENSIDISLIDRFFDEIFYDREYFKNQINNCVADETLFDIFKNLHAKSIKIECFEASKAKMYIYEKRRLSKLRLYALRVNNSCFVITGGAIKFTQKMQDHPDTQFELDRIVGCRKFLIDNEFTEESIIDGYF
jgi:hypothetical protein